MSKWVNSGRVSSVATALPEATSRTNGLIICNVHQSSSVNHSHEHAHVFSNHATASKYSMFTYHIATCAAMGDCRRPETLSRLSVHLTYISLVVMKIPCQNVTRVHKSRAERFPCDSTAFLFNLCRKVVMLQFYSLRLYLHVRTCVVIFRRPGTLVPEGLLF